MEPALKGDILDERTADLNVQFRTGKTTTSMDAKQGRITSSNISSTTQAIGKEVVAVRAGKYWRLTAKL
jgi:hypothetical protein